jgi:hypothetical protein
VLFSKIVEEGITGESKNLQTDKNAGKRQPKKETVTTVIDELNERKRRENNLLIFGIMCSSTIFLYLTQNHIVSDLDNISYSVFDFFRHFMQKCSLQRNDKL